MDDTPEIPVTDPPSSQWAEGLNSNLYGQLISPTSMKGQSFEASGERLRYQSVGAARVWSWFFVDFDVRVCVVCGEVGGLWV